MTSENPIGENPEGERANKPAKKHSNQADPPIAPTPAKSQLPPSLQKQAISGQTDKGWRDNLKLGMEAFGLAVLIAYTAFSGCQAHYTQQQARTASESLQAIKTQFQLDQRPYIAIVGYRMFDVKTSKPDHLVPATIGHAGAVSINFKNVGKSTALNVISHRHLLFQSNLSQFRIEAADTRIGPALEVQVANFLTAVSLKDTFANESPEISPSDLINWNGEEIFVFGRISYEDSFGNIYCTPYMTRPLLPNGGWIEMAGIENRSVPIKVSATDLCPVGQR